MSFRNKAYKYVKALAIKRIEWMRYGWGYSQLKYDEVMNFVVLLDLHLSNESMAKFLLKNKKLIEKLPAQNDNNNIQCIYRMMIVARQNLQKESNQIKLIIDYSFEQCENPEIYKGKVMDPELLDNTLDIRS